MRTDNALARQISWGLAIVMVAALVIGVPGGTSAQAPDAEWQIEVVRQVALPEGCGATSFIADALDVDASDRVVIAWRESGCGLPAYDTLNTGLRWGRRDPLTATWAINTIIDQQCGFLQCVGLRANPPAMALRADGTPFYIYGIIGQFDHIRLATVNLDENPTAVNPLLGEWLAQYQSSVSYPALFADFAPDAVATAAPSYVRLSGPLTLNGVEIENNWPIGPLAYAAGMNNRHHIVFYGNVGSGWGYHHSAGQPHDGMMIAALAGADGSSGVSIEADANNRLHLAVTGAPGDYNWFWSTLSYLTSDDGGATWEPIVVVNGLDASNRLPSLALDSQGHPAIAYWQYPDQIRLARFDGAEWRNTLVSTTGSPTNAPIAPKLTFDRNGRPIVLFNHQGMNALVTATLVETPRANIGVNLYADAESVDAGSPLRYFMSATNYGPADATGVTLTLTLSADVAVQSASSECTWNERVITCHGGDIANGGHVDPHVIVLPSTPGTLSATLSGVADQDDPQGNNNEAPLDVMVNALADLDVTLTHEPATLMVDELLTMHMTVTNRGPHDASHVKLELSGITDGLTSADGYELDVANDGCGTTSGPQIFKIFCELTSPLASGTSAHLTLRRRPRAIGAIYLGAKAAADERDPVSNNDTAFETLAVVERAANVGVRLLSSLPSVRFGEAARFFLSVYNNGPLPATNVRFVVSTVESFAAGLTMTEFSINAPNDGCGSSDAGSTDFAIACRLTTPLEPGELVRLNFDLTTPGGGTLRLSGRADADEHDPSLDDNDDRAQVEMVPASADVSAHLKLPPLVLVAGQPAAVEALIINQGPQPATGARLIVDYDAPRGSQPLGRNLDVPNDGCVSSSGTTFEGILRVRYTCTLTSPLAAGTLGKLTFNLVPQVGALELKATVSASEGDPDIDNNVKTLSTTVVNTPNGGDVATPPLATGIPDTTAIVTFGSVWQPGTTSVTLLSPGPAIPSAFAFGLGSLTVFDISTTASYDAPVKVCIKYGAQFGDMAPLLLHYENGQWVNRTSEFDSVNRVICALTPSLSPFVVVKPLDATAPAISGLSVDRSTLWPPNHKMTDIAVSYTVSDTSDPAPQCTVSASSNEPINGTGDGDTAPDWNVVNAHRVQLRAERAGSGSGRIYTVTVSCRDAAGNTSHKSVSVTVRK